MSGARVSLLLLLIVTLVPFLPPLLQGEVFTLRDHSDYFIPMRFHTAEVLRGGELPLWNPYNGPGEPWLANPQTAVFYPPALLFLALPFATAYVAFLAFHVMVLALGCFLLFRSWSSAPAAAFGAVCASMAGSTLSLLDTGNNLSSLAWLPWVAHAALRRGRFGAVIVPPILLTLCFLGGEPLIALVAAMTYALMVLFIDGRKAALPLLATAGVTLALSATQLLPFLELMSGTDRARGFDPAIAFSQSASLRDWAAMAVAPWAFSAGGWLSLSQTYIPNVYAGVPAVIVALAAVVSIRGLRRDDPRAWRVTMALVAIVLVTIAATTLPSTQIGRDLFQMLRLNVSRYPSRLMPVGTLALAGLAALGMDRLPRMAAVPRFGAIAMLLALLAIFGADASDAQDPWHAIAGFAEISLLAAWVGFFPRLCARPAGVAVAAIVLAADLYAAARPLLASAPFQRQSSPYSAIIPDDRRFARLHSSAAFDRFQWTAGYRNLLERKFDLSSPAPVMRSEYLQIHEAALYGRRFDLLRFLSVETLITDRELPLPVLARSAEVAVRRLPPSLPFATAWADAETVEDRAAAMARLLDGRAVGLPLISGEVVMPARSSGSARVSPVRWSARSAGVDVDAPHEVLLTLNQMEAPGWRVELDGKNVEALTANAIFRTVRVPAGRHRIEWIYDPLSVRAGLSISAVAMLFLITRTTLSIMNRKISRHRVGVP